MLNLWRMAHRFFRNLLPIFLVLSALTCVTGTVNADIFKSREILSQPKNEFAPEVKEIKKGPDSLILVGCNFFEMTNFAHNLAKLEAGGPSSILEPEGMWLIQRRPYLVYHLPEGITAGRLSLSLLGRWSAPKPFSLPHASSSPPSPIAPSPAVTGDTASQLLPAAPIIEGGYTLKAGARFTFMLNKFDNTDLGLNRLVFSSGHDVIEVPLLGYYPRLSALSKIELPLAARVPPAEVAGSFAAGGSLAFKMGALASDPISINITSSSDTEPSASPDLPQYPDSLIRLKGYPPQNGAGIAAAIAFSVTPNPGASLSMTQLSCCVANTEGANLTAFAKARLVRDLNQDGRFQEKTDRIISELPENKFQIVRLTFPDINEELTEDSRFMIMLDPQPELKGPVSLALRIAAPDIWLRGTPAELQADQWTTLATTYDFDLVHIAALVEGPMMSFNSGTVSEAKPGAHAGHGTGPGQKNPENPPQNPGSKRGSVSHPSTTEGVATGYSNNTPVTTTSWPDSSPAQKPVEKKKNRSAGCRRAPSTSFFPIILWLLLSIFIHYIKPASYKISHSAAINHKR